MDERKPFDVYANGNSAETQYVSVFFPGLGNMTVTYENRDPNNYRPVLSFDFDTIKVDIIDSRGNNREIHPTHDNQNLPTQHQSEPLDLYPINYSYPA